jgi:hypothetical protein
LEKVEEAWEKSPDWSVRSPPTVPVEEAVNVEAVFREPEVKRLEAKVEEALADSPPKELMKKTVEVPVESVTCKALAMGVEVETRVLRVKICEVLDVAATVRTALTSAVVVPIATLSVSVVKRTRVPVSVQPEATPPQESQDSPPEPSVCKQVLADCEEGQVYAIVLN